MLVRSFRRFFAGKKKPIVNTMKASKAPKARKRPQLALELLEDRVTPSTITQWTFENNAIAVNNSPTASTGAGTATPLGMTNSFNGTTSVAAADVVQGVSGDTGTNGLADLTQIWRIRGQNPGNGWSSQAPIGTQGAEFAASTVNFAGPITVNFDWYATTQGEANLQLEYTTDGSTWHNVAVTVPGADADVAAKTNSSSSNTVMGSYVQISGGQQWAPGLTATINDPAAANDPNFAIELVNASTGADDISASGGALNNTSGNWRFDNITISGTPQNATATTAAIPTFTPTTTNFGQSVSFSDVVAASSGTTAPTAGSVTFMSGSTVLATATTETTSGTQATFTISSTSVPVGAYSNITAVYNPGAGFSGSTSSASPNTLTINGTATTAAAPTFTPTTVTLGSPVSFTDVVTASSGTTAPTAGTVTFMSGSTVLATATTETTSGTQATFTVSSSTIPVGAYSNITAVYAANGAFLGSTSPASGTTLTVNPVQAPQGTIAQWTFENDSIAVNNSPAPSTGVGTASGLGMTNSFNSTTSTNTDDVLAGVSGDTGTNGLADLTQIWRIRGQNPGNGWSSQAPIGTQGAEFAASTVNFAGPITVSFDWYATTQGEANLQLEYTTDGVHWINTPITIGANSALGLTALTNSTSANTVNGSYISDNKLVNGSQAGQDWFTGLTATINDPNAQNDPNFAIELVNASTGADDVSTQGTALNNTSGNWRFDNVTISGTSVGPNFTPGNLVVLQAGDGVNNYNAQAPLFLNEITTTGTSVQQVAIPATGGVGNPANQPITIDLSAAAGNGQLTRSYDGSSLTFDGVDSTVNNGGLTSPATPTGSDNRVVAVVTGNPNIPSDINTTTDGAFYVGDDNRGSVAESPTGPIYTAGHPNQAGGAVSQGVHEFDTEGPSIGTQVSASTNIRGITIGFDNRMYFTTASGLGGAAALNTAGIFTEAQALPTSSSTTPANDIMVVPAIFGASKLGGVYFADMNGDGVLDNGDRLYFVDDGTVGGAGTGGLYVATWNDSNTSNPWNTNGPGQGGNNAAAVAAGIINHWSAPVRLGDAPIQTGSGGVGQLRGLTGTVISPTEADLYTTAYDDAPGDSSYVQQWKDTNTGVAIASASESGTTVTITTATPNAFTSGEVVEIDGVGANNGAGAITSGYNGAWSITVIDSTHFTYSDTNGGASNLGTVNNQGAADVTVSGTIIQQLAAGTDTVGATTVGEVGLRGVSFAPVAATTMTLAQSPANPLTPGSAVTLTATLTNSQVTPTGQVAFIDQNTNTVLGFGTIGTSGGVTTASLTLPTGVVGNHFVKAYFGGGGTADLASANSNTIQVIEAGSTASSTGLNASLSATAIGKQDTLTATVTDPNSGGTPTGTVSFYNGSIALANLLGTSALSGSTATLKTSFGTAGAQTILAVYNGDNTYASSEATTTVNVAANATATITTSANNVALNATPTYTVTINGNATLGTPAGTVTFTIVSATDNTNGKPLVSQTSSAMTLTPGSGNTATATWTSPALSAPGSYFVTVSYSATGATNPYSNLAINTTSATSGVTLIETVQQAFTPGDLVAVQRGDGTVNLGSSAYPVELVEYKPAGGAEVQAIVLPNVDSGTQHALFLSGQNGSEGLLNRSANGADLTIGGYDLPAGHTFVTSTFPFQFPRTIAEVGASGAVDTSTAISTAQVGITAASETGTTVTITTATASGFTVGEQVVITGITPAGYDGQVTVTGVSGTTFTYTVAAGLGAATVSSAFATSASVPYNPLDVVSNDGKEFWLASNLPVGDTTDNGIEYVASVGATSATQIGAGNNSAAAVSISGGQLYVTKGSGNIDALGTGLPTTTGQTLIGLPNLANVYASFFPNSENPEQVLLLNTNDGTTNNPNVAYIADQANGLLKFYLNTASIGSLSESGTTVTVATSAANGFTTGDQVRIAGASVAGYNGTYTVTVIDGTHFTFTAATSGLANATGGSASEWLYGKNGTGVFGQKLIFAGGATGLTGYVTHPGAGAQVQLFVTGVNVQQQNPNQIDSLLDTNAPSQGFPSGVNVTNLEFVGGASPSGSPNGNENFAGLAFVPGAVTTTTVASSAPVTTYGNNVTFTATVTSPVDTPAGTVTFFDGTTVLGTSTLNGSGVATFTTTTPLSVGAPTIYATYNPGGQSLANDDVSTGTLTQQIDYTAGDLIVSQVGFSSNVASVSVNGSTVTVTTTNPLPFALNASNLFLTVAGNNGTNINGSYPITLISPTSFSYTASGAVGGTGGTVSLASSFGISAVTVSGSTVTVTTSSSSGFLAGQPVTIAGATGGTNINGTFTLISASGTTLKYISSGAVAPTSVTGSTAAGPTNLGSGQTATYLDDYTVNPSTGATTLNTANTVNLPTATASATITGATWSISNDTATFTTSAAHNMQPGQLVTISGVVSSGSGSFNGTFTILSVPTTTTFVVGLLADPGTYTSGGSAQVDQNALTEGGTSTTTGYVTTSVDGHSVEIGGTTGSSSDIGVLNPDGAVNDSTILPSAVSGVRAVASPDGSGFWVATGTGIRFVPFGGETPSAVTGATWANTNGGTATITAPNTYVAGQTVIVAGIGGATGFNGTFTVLSASANSFSYFLATQPTGTPTFTGATSQLLPTLVTNEADNLQNGQFPSTVTIGTDLNGNPNQLFGDAGNQFQTSGVNSIDGPFQVGSGLPTTGGQPITIYGNGTGTNFPNSTDRFGNFPTSAQFAISPDGNTVFVADSRTDGLGGILEYTQVTTNNWRLVGNLQLDSFKVTGATETGSTVTITTSSPTDFFVGESVSVTGVSLAAYDGTFTVTGVSGSTFTYTANFTGLAPSGVNVTGAFATSADGGVRGLAVDFTDNGANDGKAILYVTTSGTSGNRLEEITGGTLDGSNATLSQKTSALATAAPGTAYRGVAFAPTAPGTTASTTSLHASGNTLTATVTSGATGWVEFFQVVGTQNVYIGTAFENSGTATLNTTGLLPAGSYTVFAVYTGNSTFAASTSAQVSDTIASIGTTTTLTFSPSTVGTNQSDTLTATINVPAGQSPTGLVTFTNTTSGTTLGYGTVSQVIQNIDSQPVVTFVATLTVPAGTFTAGTYNISAAYSGDAYFGSSTGTGSLSVVNSTTTTVTSNAADPSAGSSLTLSATVTSTANGTPTGTVQFYDDTLALGSAVTLNSSGVATLTVPTTLVQSVSVLSASASGTTVTLTTDANNPMFVGEEVVVEGISTSAYDSSPGQTFPNIAQFFTVTAVSGNTFSYVDNAANGAPTDTKGGLAIGLNVLTPGLHSISAVYMPTGTSFAGSTGVHEQSVQAQAFGASDTFVERNGDGITPLNTRSPNPVLGSIGVTVYADEFTPSGTLVQSFILPSADSQAFTVLSASETGNTVTLTLSSPTDFVVGQQVTIAGVSVADYNNDANNNVNAFTITAVSNPVGGPYTISYTDSVSGLAAGSGGTATGVVHAVVGDGQQSTTGQMALSGDGQDLFITGYDNNPLPFGTALPVPSGTGSNNVPRSIAQISYNGTVQTEAFNIGVNGIDSTSGNSGVLNGIYSPDGNQFYLSSFNGIYYFPSLTQSASLQGSLEANQIDSTSYTVNGLDSYGGNLYAIGTGSSGGTANRIQEVGTGLPTTTDFSAITGASWASQVASITANNNFAVGQSVLIDNIGGATGYNGVFTITAASATSFSYALTTQPTGTPTFTGAYAVLQTPLTQLPGIPVNSTAEPIPVFFGVDAYFTHTNTSVPGNALDTIYLADDGKSFGGGDITKWSLNSVGMTSITQTGATATVTLSAASAATLNLTTGEVVNLTISGETGAAAGYNGTWAVTVSNTTNTQFTFTAPTGLTGDATPAGQVSGFVEAKTAILYSQSTPQLGFYWLAGQTNSKTGAVTLYTTYGNGGNGDFGPGILYSVTDSNGFNNAPGTPITAVSWSGGTVTVTANNNFVAGNFVDVEGVTPSGYDGQFTIVSATPTQFTYALATNPGAGTVTGAYANSVNVVNSVAFEGAGGGFIGNETYRGVALAPQALVQSVVTNGDYIPITGASLSGGVVTLTTDGNSGFTAGNQIVVAGYTGTSAGYNGTYTILSVNGNQVTYADANTGMPTLTFNSVGYAISANTTSALQPGAGTNHQRSMVDSIVYTFNQAVNLSGTAFTFADAAGATHTGPATLSTGVPNYTLTSLNGGTVWVLTFLTGTNNTVTGHSIADGVYNVTLAPTGVTLSNQATASTTRPTDTFYRLFGDYNGSKRVNPVSASQFNNTFGLQTGQAGYLDFFDFNGDGRVNAVDASSFNNRFGSSWSGFTPSI